MVILDNHNLGYDAFNKMCAGINKNNQEEGERKAPNSNSLYGGFYRRFNLIFRFEIEYRTTVLSRSLKFFIEITYTLERHVSHSQITMHKTSLHRVG